MLSISISLARARICTVFLVYSKIFTAKLASKFWLKTIIILPLSPAKLALSTTIRAALLRGALLSEYSRNTPRNSATFACRLTSIPIWHQFRLAVCCSNDLMHRPREFESKRFVWNERYRLNNRPDLVVLPSRLFLSRKQQLTIAPFTVNSRHF